MPTPPRPLRRVAVGPAASGPELFVVSVTDALLEARQNTPERQFYLDGSVVSLRPGDTVIDVGANIGSFARMASLLVAPPSDTCPQAEPERRSSTLNSNLKGGGLQSNDGGGGSGGPAPGEEGAGAAGGAAPPGVVQGAGVQGAEGRVGCKGQAGVGGRVQGRGEWAEQQGRVRGGEVRPDFREVHGGAVEEQEDIGGAAVGKQEEQTGRADPRQGLVLAVEPLPTVFKALVLNIQQHKQWAARQRLAAAPIVPVECGLGCGSAAEAPFTYYPRCTAFSTMYRNERDALQATLALVVNGAAASAAADAEREPEAAAEVPSAAAAAAAHGSAAAAAAAEAEAVAGAEAPAAAAATAAATEVEGEAVAEAVAEVEPKSKAFGFRRGSGSTANGTVATATWLQWLAQRVVRSPLGAVYKPLHMAVFKTLFLSGVQQVTCKMQTVSGLIRQHRLSEVSLLKINVERAEEDVLLGVEAGHWPLIQQVSMQLHDLDGRLDRLEGMLRAAGFPVVVRWQEPRFRGCSLWMLFASRRATQE